MFFFQKIIILGLYDSFCVCVGSSQDFAGWVVLAEIWPPAASYVGEYKKCKLLVVDTVVVNFRAERILSTQRVGGGGVCISSTSTQRVCELTVERIAFYLHREWAAAGCAFHLHREWGRDAGVGFSVHKELIVGRALCRVSDKGWLVRNSTWGAT